MTEVALSVGDDVIWTPAKSGKNPNPHPRRARVVEKSRDRVRIFVEEESAERSVKIDNLSIPKDEER